MNNITQNFYSQENNVNDSERTIEHYIVTKELNRKRQLVNAKGMNDDDFSKNPIVLFNHGGDMFSSGEKLLAIGNSLWRKEKSGNLLAKTNFGTHQLANDVFEMNKQGIMNSWSIGFNIDEYNINEKEEIININKWTLLEYSSVYIPADAGALNINNMDYMKNALSIVKTPYLMNEIASKHIELEAKNEVSLIKNEIEKLKAEFNSYEEKLNKKDFENTIAEFFKIYHNTQSKKLLEIVAESNGIILNKVQELIPSAVSGAIRQAMGKI